MKTKEQKIQHLLAEIRTSCHLLWGNSDPNVQKAWHTLFDAHNEVVLDSKTIEKSAKR